MAKPIDETGNTYGRLKVIKEIGRKRGAVLFLCHCDCGNDVEITGGDLRSGRVNSCGCLKSELIIKENTTHGLREHRLYSIYHNMIGRCYKKCFINYIHYGERGIKVCDEWLIGDEGLLNFYNWAINNGYNDNLTIDRIDVNGDYEPENCRWVTNEIQQNNKRSTRYVEIEGKIKSLKQWCKEYNINYSTVRNRLSRGWSAIDAIITPTHKQYLNKRYL